MKMCYMCRKNESEVYFTPNGCNRCQACHKEYGKQYRAKNKAKIAIEKKNYYEKNKEQELTRCRKWYSDNLNAAKNSMKIYREINKEKIALQKKAYYHKNKEYWAEKGKKRYEDNKILMRERNKKYRLKHKDKQNTRQTNRKKNDVKYRISCTLRSNLWDALKKANAAKCAKTFELTGCTIDFLKHYIESQFTQGMTWDNWGYGVDKWNIDHIKPVTKFDLTDPYEQRLCFNYRNLQPMWQGENFYKKNKWDIYQDWAWEMKNFIY